MKKFELTSESIVKFGKTLYRIRALMAFGDVKEGELGGFLEKEENLDQSGNAWVSGDAWVCGNARVYDDARVCGNAWVYDDARVSGDALVCGNAWVYGNARVYGNALVYGNARVYGNAWVYDDARVYGNAWVCGNARVYGDARVFRIYHYLVIGPMGSRNDFTTFFRTKNLFIGVSCGCFRGNVDEFVEKVKETHGNNKHAKAYFAAAELAKMQIDLTPEENEPEE